MAKKELHGWLKLILEDGNIEIVTIYKAGRSIYLSYNLYEHLVHPSNDKNIEGWAREIRHVWPNLRFTKYQYYPPWISPYDNNNN